MAETQGFKARVEYEVTDGTQLLYTFPFSYLRKKFIKVDVLHADNSITTLTYGVDYVVNDLSLTLTNHAKVGEHLIIYRQTTTDKIITWNDGSILLASDMNTADVQMLHLQEEQQDYIQAHSINTKTDSATKEVLWDALNHRVVNVSDPIDPQDAVTKHYMESVQDGFVARNTSLLEQATTQATNAKNSASSSATSASMSASSASASETSNQSAKKWAESTYSPDNQTDMDSTTGKTQSSRSWALYSKVKAQEAATSATNAKSSETKAKTSETNAKSSETNAKTSEQKAKTSETNAKTSETNARASEINAETAETDAVRYSNSAYSSYIKSQDWAESTGSPNGENDSLSATGKTRSARGWAMQAKEYAGSLNLSFILDTLLPVGTVYMTENANFDPNKTWGVGVWVKTAIDRVLQGTSDKNKVGTTIEAGLPDITGSIATLIYIKLHDNQVQDGCFKGTKVNKKVVYLNDATSDNFFNTTLSFTASTSNPIYGKSTTVQPPAELVFIWKRIA